MNGKKNTLLYALLISALLLVFRFFSIQSGDFLWDIYYSRMAVNPYWGEGSPWGSRILTPYLVYLCPWSTPLGFYTVNLTALWLTAAFSIVLCREMGVRLTLAFAAAPIYLFSSGVEWQLKEIWFNDAIGHLFLCLAVLATVKKRDSWVCFFSLLGAFNRSTALYLIPVWYAYNFGCSIRLKNLRSLLLVWSLPVFVTLLIHLCYIPLTSYSYIDSFSGLNGNQNFIQFFMNDFLEHTPSGFALFHRIFSYRLLNCFFGLLLPIFGLALFRLKSPYKSLSFWTLIVWMQFFVGRDVGRLETYAFPVLIPLAFLYIQQAVRDDRCLIIVSIVLAVSAPIVPNHYVFLSGCAFAAWLFYEEKRNSHCVENALGEDRQSSCIKIENRWFLDCAPFVGTLAVLIWFGSYCWTTYTLRPDPMLSFPPVLLDRQNNGLDLGVSDSSGVIKNVYKYTGENTDETSMISIGSKGIGSEQVLFRLKELEGSHSQKTLLLKLWGEVDRGDRLYIDLGRVVGREIQATFESFSPINPERSRRRFSQLFFLHRLKDEDCLILGRDSTWSGKIQFVLFDATKIVSYGKPQEAVRNEM